MPPAATQIRTSSSRSARPGRRCVRSGRPSGSARPARYRSLAWPGRSSRESLTAYGAGPRPNSGGPSGAWQTYSRTLAGREDYPKSVLVDDDAADVLALGHVLVGLVHLVERVLAGDQLVQ